MTLCMGTHPVCDTMMDIDQNYCVFCNVTADCNDATKACSMVTGFLHECLLATGQSCTMDSQCANGTCAAGMCN